jgi:hypothetical protein
MTFAARAGWFGIAASARTRKTLPMISGVRKTRPLSTTGARADYLVRRLLNESRKEAIK